MTVAYSDSLLTLYVDHGRAKPVPRGPNSTEPNLFHRGETDCLTTLLPCFRNRISVPEVIDLPLDVLDHAAAQHVYLRGQGGVLRRGHRGGRRGRRRGGGDGGHGSRRRVHQSPRRERRGRLIKRQLTSL